MKTLFAWDFHGVLEKGNVKTVRELINMVFNDLGVNREITLQEALDWYGLSWFDYFKLALPGKEEEFYKGLVDGVLKRQKEAWALVQKNICAMDFAEEVLGLIKSKGHHNIVLSNSRPQHIKDFVDLLHLAHYFEEIIGVDGHHESRMNNVRNAKEEALRGYLSGKDYGKVVLIGDRESDVAAGRSCGAITYFFVNPDKREAGEGVGSDHVISDLREVLNEL